MKVVPWAQIPNDSYLKYRHPQGNRHENVLMGVYVFADVGKAALRKENVHIVDVNGMLYAARLANWTK